MANLELKALIGLHRTVNAIDRESARVCSAAGLTLGQFAVLEALFHKGDLTVGQVQEKILSTSGTIPLIVGNLEKQGYLIRQRDEVDKRCRILHLTQKGKEVVERVFPGNEKVIIEATSCWSDEEKQQLVSLLEKFGGCQREKNR